MLGVRIYNGGNILERMYCPKMCSRPCEVCSILALRVSASTAVVAAPQVLRVEAKISGHMLAWFWPIRARRRPDLWTIHSEHGVRSAVQCYVLCTAPLICSSRLFTFLSTTVVYRTSLLGDTTLHLSVPVPWFKRILSRQTDWHKYLSHHDWMG